MSMRGRSGGGKRGGKGDVGLALYFLEYNQARDLVTAPTQVVNVFITRHRVVHASQPNILFIFNMFILIV